MLFLEILPEPDLYEPIAIGARWYKDDEATLLVSDREHDEVQWLEPRKPARTVRVAPRSAPELQGQIVSQTVRRLRRNEWLTIKSLPVPTIAFEIECEVSIPKNASGGRLLLLIEFPGREYWPSSCSATLNGTPVSLAYSSSDGHIGDPLTQDPWEKEVKQFESHWKWYDCAVPAGSSRVKFSGLAGFEQPRVGLWLWSEEPLKMLAQPLHSTSSAPSMPEYRADIERDGICIRLPTQII